MDSVPRIRAARWADKDAAAALIADAFEPSALAAWLVPEPPHRRRILADVLAIWVEHALFFGDIYLADDLTAATVGFHRYRPIPPPANYRLRLQDAAGPHADRFHLLDQLLSGPRPTEPHYHLAVLAVRSDAQRTGRGTAMLAHHRARVDRVGLPSWTDTTTGVGDLYARYGYTHRPPITLPDGPTIHPMRRNPDTVSGYAWPLNTAHTSVTRSHDHPV
ncbi:GNAT family N-acetyltransferase [Micromonospora sp. NPDC126480]|uniref:GNAT family N-acetyltransferase n=1 Tax=Micromonospora sp. NPDC126480 TaxID=3155312 RepID=UPI00332E191F